MPKTPTSPRSVPSHAQPYPHRRLHPLQSLLVRVFFSPPMVTASSMFSMPLLRSLFGILLQSRMFPQFPCTPMAATPEKQILAAITEDGTVEFFSKPFIQPQNAPSASAKANRKQMTQKANASSQDSRVPIFKRLCTGCFRFVPGSRHCGRLYAEGGVIPVFERVKSSTRIPKSSPSPEPRLARRPSPARRLSSVTTNGAKDLWRESR